MIAQTQKRIDGLDIMKAFAIMMVITLHIPLWQTDFITYPSGLASLQYAMRLIAEGVPIFLVINGFLLFRKRELDLNKHLKKIGKILGIFFAWAVILTIVGSWMSNEPLTISSLLTYILNTAVGSKYTGVLWFLQGLVAVYLIFPVLWHIYHEHYKVFTYIFVILFIFSEGYNTIILIRDFVSLYADTTIMNAFLAMIMKFNFTDNLWYVFYFCLGGILWRNIEKIEKYRARLCIVGGVAWILAFAYGYILSIHMGAVYNPAYNYNSPFMLFFLIGMLALLLPYENKGRRYQKLLSSIGANTFGIYLSHYIFIFIINRYYVQESFKDRFAAYIAVFVCSYIFSIVIKRIPILHWIIEL